VTSLAPGPADWPPIVLEGIELRLVELEFARPIATSAGTHDRRPVVLVRMIGSVGLDWAGEGWGEAGALAEGTSVDPPVASVWESLVGALGRVSSATEARDGLLPEPSVVARLLGDGPVHRMAGAALEMAALDLGLRRAGRSLAQWLGGAGGTVEAGAVAGIPAGHDPGALVDEVAALVESGFTRVRLKIAPGFDVVPVSAVRAAFPDLHLQADANGAYRADEPGGPRDAGRLAGLDGLGLVCLEQPLPPADLAAHAQLASAISTPIALDESLSSPRRVADAVRYGACAVACLKPARLGGLVAARRALAVCVEAGIPAFVGGFFETGLGRSANAALASVAGFTLAGDLSSPSGYLMGDPFEYPPVVGGRVAVPDRPGIAPGPDPGPLERRTVAVHAVTAR